MLSYGGDEEEVMETQENYGDQVTSLEKTLKRLATNSVKKANSTDTNIVKSIISGK